MVFQNSVSNLLDLVWFGLTARTLDVYLLGNTFFAIQVMAATDSLIKAKVK